MPGDFRDLVHCLPNYPLMLSIRKQVNFKSKSDDRAIGRLSDERQEVNSRKNVSKFYIKQI